VVERLDPRSHACPLSTRELLGPAGELGLVLPLVASPVAAVARAALVAAKELQSAIGLGLPPGASPEPWFDDVFAAADELAAGLPIFLAGEVTVAGEGAALVERAFHQAWRLVGAGITHLAVDVAAVAPAERGRVVGEIAEAGVEHGICVEVVVPLAEGAPRLAAVLDSLRRRGGPADLASVRCPAPADEREARLQAGALARIAQAVPGVPLMRRGPATPELLDLLPGSPVRVCDDGGLVAAGALSLVPAPAGPPGGADAPSRGGTPLERAVAGLTGAALERIEARAYVDALDLLERLGGRGSAAALTRALERRLEDR
jgi:hypothetical protein